jgi:hypothetical protein
MKHWTDDDITQWVYGLVDQTAHLDECSVCLGRALAAKDRRAQVVKAVSVEESDGVAREFLEAQRRAIYRRMGNGERGEPVWLRFRLAGSVGLALGVALLSFNLMHRSTTYDQLASPADDKLYSEMVAIDQNSEPRAIQPMQKLFEE